MTEDKLNRANSLQQKIDAVNNLLEGISMDNTITIGVGMYDVIRCSAEISDTNDKVQEIEQRMYNRIKEILEAYKSKLVEEFNSLV